jgi:hypothetical protein
MKLQKIFLYTFLLILGLLFFYGLLMTAGFLESKTLFASQDNIGIYYLLFTVLSGSLFTLSIVRANKKHR